nr:atherin-like [Aegilops tauschii subsp. strangulata]
MPVPSSTRCPAGPLLQPESLSPRACLLLLICLTTGAPSPEHPWRGPPEPPRVVPVADAPTGSSHRSSCTNPAVAAPRPKSLASPPFRPLVGALLQAPPAAPCIEQENERTSSARVDRALAQRPRSACLHQLGLNPWVARVLPRSLVLSRAAPPPSSTLLRPPPIPDSTSAALAPAPPRAYLDVLMTRVEGDGQAWPKQPLPASSSSRPADGSSSRSDRGEGGRPSRSSEVYPGTSLRRPPRPRDPRLPLPGSPGDARRWEDERLRRDDLEHESSLRAELVARPLLAARDRDPPAPRALDARDSSYQAEVGDWCWGRDASAQDDRLDDGSHGSRASAHARGDDRRQSREGGRRDDRRPARSDGPAWRRDDPPPGPKSPGRRYAEAPAVTVQAKKKKHKKKVVVVDSGVAVGPAPTGVPEQAAPESPSRVGRPRTREETMCINCDCVGHFRLEGEAPPRCPTTLAYLGYGTERGGFYYVDAEIEEEAVRPHLATVTLAPEQVLPSGVVISADLIQAELAAYIGYFRGSDFTSEVTETAPLVFSVPFPKLLRVCSHDFVRCPISKILISVRATDAEPDPVPSME